MGPLLSALLNLQTIERKLAQVRARLRTRKNAVAAQEHRIEKLQEDWQALHEQSLSRRRDSDRFELELRDKEQQVSKLRSALNTARTNKEYATILTQINTLKADNAKLEDSILRILQQSDEVKGQADGIQEKVNAEQERLAEIKASSAEEIERLTAMLDDLQRQRAEAAKSVEPSALAAFDRIAESYDGLAMAPIEVHGNKPPYTYVCGGCFMSLNAEHANALRVRDEIRTCDNCGRILYMMDEKEHADA
jgi:predicted  nucleic acid-binding Zn-ribbon protein